MRSTRLTTPVPETFDRECATAAACLLFNEDGSVNYEPSADQIEALFQENFDRFYHGNRAPFPLYLSEDWIKNEGQRQGLFQFIEKVTRRPDVFVVTIGDTIEWMKAPRSVEAFKTNRTCPELRPTKCAMTDDDSADLSSQFKKYCDFTQIGALNGLTKRMVICDDAACPADYPWTDHF